MGIWLVIPVVIAVVVAGGVGTCLALGAAPHTPEMLFGAAVCLVAGELAIIPIVLTRGATQATIAQSSLVSMMVHLFTAAALSGSLIMFKPVPLSNAFVYWVMTLYGCTLIALVAVLIREIKHAPVGTPSVQKLK